MDLFDPDAEWEDEQPPSNPPTKGIKGSRVLVGALLAGVGHIGVLALVRQHSSNPNWPMYGLKLQLGLFLLLVIVAVVLLRWVDRGVGMGLLIGWAVGALTVGPALGFASAGQGCRQLFGDTFSGGQPQ